jgi:hypothetical protein
MLPTQEEQDKKWTELEKVYCEKDSILHNHGLFAEEYAKWLCTEVIKHCAEVAKIKMIEDGFIVVDKQSILNVINEL